MEYIRIVADRRELVGVEGRKKKCLQIKTDRREYKSEDMEDTKKGPSGRQKSVSGLQQPDEMVNKRTKKAHTKNKGGCRG